jgi:hypothetical protein
MDWPAWAQRFQAVKGPDAFEALFAADRQFCDPVTPWTSDVRKVAEQTDALFPDWHQAIDSIRGGEDWAVFEWTGTATFQGSIPVVVHGATVVEVDSAGLVTRWRDYLDTNEPMSQIQNASNTEGS